MPSKKQTEPKRETEKSYETPVPKKDKFFDALGEAARKPKRPESEQANHVVSLGHALVRLAGVSSAWVASPSDHEADLYVTVLGFDKIGLYDQMQVYRVAEKFAQETREEMDSGEFAFNYSVLVDDDALGESLIPRGAKRIA